MCLEDSVRPSLRFKALMADGQPIVIFHLDPRKRERTYAKSLHFITPYGVITPWIT
jgi:hypothetical protein